MPVNAEEMNDSVENAEEDLDSDTDIELLDSDDESTDSDADVEEEVAAGAPRSYPIRAARVPRSAASIRSLRRATDDQDSSLAAPAKRRRSRQQGLAASGTYLLSLDECWLFSESRTGFILQILT